MNSIKEMLDVTYDYTSVQINVPKKISNALIRFAEKRIDKKDLYYDPTDKSISGVETEVHITLLYGLTNPSDVVKIIPLLSSHHIDMINVKWNGIDKFADSDKPYDILIYKISSPDLEKIHSLLKNSFNNVYSYNSYVPHSTIAYLKKGTADKYVKSWVSVKGTLTTNTITISLPNGERKHLTLKRNSEFYELANSYIN